jgi:hypothetical protein
MSYSLQHGARVADSVGVLLQVRFEAAASLASKAFSSEEVQVRPHSSSSSSSIRRSSSTQQLFQLAVHKCVR